MLFPESPSQNSRHTAAPLQGHLLRTTSLPPAAPGYTALRPPHTKPGPPSPQGLLGLPDREAGSVRSGPTSSVAGSPAPRTGPGPQQAPNKRALTVTPGPGRPQGSHTTGLLPGRPGSLLKCRVGLPSGDSVLAASKDREAVPMGRLHLKWRKRPRLPQQTGHLRTRASSGPRGAQVSAAGSGGPGT